MVVYRNIFQCATDRLLFEDLCKIQKESCLLKFLEEFWQLSNHFYFRWSVKKSSPYKLPLTMKSTVLKLKVYSLTPYYNTRLCSLLHVTHCSLKWGIQDHAWFSLSRGNKRGHHNSKPLLGHLHGLKYASYTIT